MKDLKDIVITFRVTKEEKEALKDFAQKKELSVSYILREALSKYMGIK